MNNRQRGDSTVLILLVVLALMTAYCWRNAYNIKADMTIPTPYSAKYAVAVENGYHKEAQTVQQGLYCYEQRDDGVLVKWTLALMGEGKFQIDVSIWSDARNEDGRPDDWGSLRGKYVQAGSVLEFSDLTGDRGLLPDPSKLLLGTVGMREIDIFIPSVKHDQLVFRFTQSMPKH